MQDKPICIIPARGGSKRVPRKNVRLFNGKPLIAWPIRTAVNSSIFSRVIVSTDDDETADIAKEHGAEIPFMRSPELADDHSTTAAVLIDALQRLDAPDCFCCLYPTAPLVSESDLINACSLLKEKGPDGVISVCEFEFPPLRAFELDQAGRISFKWPEYELTRSQDLPELLHDAGAFYFLRTDRFREQGRLVMDDTLPYLMERNRVQDIDTEQDLELAELLHRQSGR